jgi:hypothetical protein
MPRLDRQSHFYSRSYAAVDRTFRNPASTALTRFLTSAETVTKTLTISGGQQARNGSAPAAARRAPTTAARTASRTNPVSSGGARTVSSAQSSHLQAQHAAQLAEMTAQVQDLQVAYEDLERERAFYFDSASLFRYLSQG